MAKPEVLEVDGLWLGRALLEFAPACDIKLGEEEHTFLKLQSSIKQWWPGWGNPARWHARGGGRLNERVMGSPSCDFTCRPLEFEALPGYERIAVEGVLNVQFVDGHNESCGRRQIVP